MTHFIGIDPGSRIAGLASLTETGDLKTQTIHPTGHPEDRLVQLRRLTRQWLTFAADEGAFCVVVEQPGTRYGGATLLAAYGVMVEAARSMLPDTPLMALPSARWKLLALGRGNAKKADVMAGARLLGYTGASQDAADATVMADAARVLFAQSTREAA